MVEQLLLNVYPSFIYYCKTITMLITVFITVVILKTVLFRKQTLCEKFPSYGIITDLWIRCNLLFKPFNEVVHQNMQKHRTFWLRGLVLNMFCTKDPYLIKLIGVQNSQCFPDRMDIPNVGDTLMDKGIMYLKNPQWKMCRSALSHIFTISKMKKMCPQIENCIQSLKQKLYGLAEKGLAVDAKSILDRHTLDIIAASAFDFSLISTRESSDEFAFHSLNLISNYSTTKLAVAGVFPWIYTILGFEFYPRKSLHYFKTLVKNTIEERRNGLQVQPREDLIQLLLKKGKQIVNEKTSISTREEFSIEEITAHTMTFLLAGFETTSTTLCSIIYCLAQNPECQDKLFEEIEKTKDREISQVDIPYLEAVISEAMRLYPSVPSLQRTAVRDCHVDGIFFPKNTVATFAVYSVHRDPEIFPDPEMFLPDRFLTGDYNADAFLPFGLGPRKCMGFYFALMEIKATLIQLVQTFKFISAQKEYKIKINTPILVPKEMFVKIEKRMM